MKKYIVMLGLTLVIGLIFSNGVLAQNEWTPENSTTTMGKVGIGTLIPEVDFHISRNAVVDYRLERPGFLENGAIGRFRIQTGEPADNGYIFNMALRRRFGDVEMTQGVYNPTLGQWLSFNMFNADLRKYTISPGVFEVEFQNEGHVLLNNLGAVGINVSEDDADAKLDGVALGVNGTIVTTELIVQEYGDWPDFVFAEGYDLMSLNEIEEHINQNGYLPNVPNEREVMENGVNLGKMSSILLQKVEELTLHVIELNKQNEELKRRVSELEK
jgi:hypothetical protein